MFCKKIVCSVTRKDKKAIATQSVKGAKRPVENLSIEYFISTFWLLVVNFVILFYSFQIF